MKGDGEERPTSSCANWAGGVPISGAWITGTIVQASGRDGSSMKGPTGPILASIEKSRDSRVGTGIAEIRTLSISGIIRMIRTEASTERSGPGTGHPG